jgi:hypothetical protein
MVNGRSWRRSMQKLDKQLKVKILGIFLISQACMYLLASTDTDSPPMKLTPKVIESRINYIQLTIRAESYTNKGTNDPVVITNSRRSIYIPNCFIIEQIKEIDPIVHSEFESLPAMASKFRVYVHKKYAYQLLKNTQFLIIPNLEKSLILKNKSRGVNYEISI